MREQPSLPPSGPCLVATRLQHKGSKVSASAICGRALDPAFAGSNPAAPANSPNLLAYLESSAGDIPSACASMVHAMRRKSRLPHNRYLQKRRQTWYVRVAVPPSLIPVIGKSHIVRSLKTRDAAVARERRW